MNEKERDALLKAQEALKEIAKHNRLRNDLDAYLFDLTKWGLGVISHKPNKINYFI